MLKASSSYVIAYLMIRFSVLQPVRTVYPVIHANVGTSVALELSWFPFQ